MKLIQFRPEGIYCELGDFFIDPWLPVKNALITHGHGDHARWGMENYLCHHHTVPILKSRISEDIQVQGISYNEKIKIGEVWVSFHPAGHILGSAQIRIEYKGQVLVVSGDYKLQDDGLSTPFEPIKCHEFITESTFGLPIYQWKSITQLNQEIIDWVESCKKESKTPILVGYSLGKAQRIMKALEGYGELYTHFSIDRLNQAYESVGIKLPEYQVWDARNFSKIPSEGILIIPPALVDSQAFKKITNRAYSICSGWMTVRGSRRWRSADAGFAMSDHADWNELLSAIRQTEAEKIYVTHGQTHVFSKYLRELGYESEVVQTEFGNEAEEEKELLNSEA